MKMAKKILMAATTGMIILTTTVSVFAVKESYIRGDADGDGKVSITDVTAIQRKLLSVDVKNFNEKAADVDGNGLKIADAIKIQRYLVGYDNNTYRIGETVYDDYDEYELPFIPVG